MRALEYKSHFGEVKDVDTKNRIVTGVLANWNKDHHNDIIEKGAFRKTLLERKEQILFLNQHSWQQPHGYFAELEEMDAGLRFVSNPLPNTTFSNDALELYARGIVKEHSIGFEVIKSDYDSDTDIRIIKEIKLYEGSNVTLGANSSTPFTGFKAMTKEELQGMVKSIIDCLRVGTLTDETFLRLELALKQLQTEAYRKGREEALNQPGDPDPTDPTLPKKDLSTIQNFILQL